MNGIFQVRRRKMAMTATWQHYYNKSNIIKYYLILFKAEKLHVLFLFMAMLSYTTICPCERRNKSFFFNFGSRKTVTTNSTGKQEFLTQLCLFHTALTRNFVSYLLRSQN